MLVCQRLHRTSRNVWWNGLFLCWWLHSRSCSEPSLVFKVGACASNNLVTFYVCFLPAFQFLCPPVLICSSPTHRKASFFLKELLLRVTYWEMSWVWAPGTLVVSIEERSFILTVVSALFPLHCLPHPVRQAAAYLVLVKCDKIIFQSGRWFCQTFILPMLAFPFFISGF